ncbi:hypothetical protein Daus18300_014079 [Diaporthe australafricana]|uniref:CCCH zinc finger domain-containing protein n=1 Tax=Diaporthe australafricana TaxID=127596 RepID=A0ABR3VWM0_9PEZI
MAAATATAAMTALSIDDRPPGSNAPIPFLLTSLKKPRPQPLDLSLALAANAQTKALATRDPNARPVHPFATVQSAGSDHESNQTNVITAITVELDIWSPTVRYARSPGIFGLPCQADDTMQLDSPKTSIFLSRSGSQYANSFSVFKDNCRFEHPSANGSASANPFSVLSGNSNNNSRGGFGRQPPAQSSQFSLSKDTIQKDLAEERPSWLLSAYGPGRDAPEQLWGGYPIEQSFEEIRLHYMMGEASGNPQGALSEIQGLWGQAQGKIQSALGNLDGAINFVLQSQNTHPNRHDVCQTNSSPSTGEFAVGKHPVGIQPSQPSNAFSAPSTGGAFGQPSALGRNANPFSTGASGASGSSPFAQGAVTAQPSGFGQPSALGSGGSAFGQPSALGGGNAFGQPSALGGGSVFGKPSGLGQTAGSGFGQTSALGQSASPFGAPSFGQPAQPSQPAPSGGFGQPSQLGTKPNPFSSGGAAASNSPFGALGGASSNPSPFATNAQPPQSGAVTSNNPFGQPAQQQSTTPEVSMDTSGPSATPNPFAQASNPPAAPANPFGQPSQTAASNPFAQAAPAGNGFAAAGQKPAGATPGGANPYAPNAARQHPSYDSYARKAPTGQLLSFKGKQVTYKEMGEKGEAPKQVPGIRNFDGSWTKIWFPDGPPPYYKDTEPDRAYTDGEKAAYEQLVSTGRFTLAGSGGGGMPEAPPMREYCTWDL